MMTTLLTSSPGIPTLGDLLDRLGGIPPQRVRYYPLPGTATEADVAQIERRENRLCELVDGVLVEKPMGFRESIVAGWILTALNVFVMPRRLGVCAGADGMMRIMPGLVRIPDVAFISTERLPEAGFGAEPVPRLVPDLVVEVLSDSNTGREMSRKRDEYFDAGVRLVWEIDIVSQTAAVYTPSTGAPMMLTGSQSLEGGEVLPGFSLPLADLFGRLNS